VRRAHGRKITDPALVRRVADLLAAGGGWAERVVAYELLEANEAAFRTLTDSDVRGMPAGMADWASIDLFGVTIAGQAWREGILSERGVKEWARSSDRWMRRLSLVATVPLNSRARGGSGDAKRTLALCAMHVDDRDPMVVKALSWALRELAKRDPGPVREFVAEHDVRLAALVKREVGNKLRTGLKSGKRPARRR
jgi:3-methyladenine DNA glycosylase AlkD